MPTPRSTSNTEIIREFDVAEMITQITELARVWTENGDDLAPDGLARFRVGLCRIFGVPFTEGTDDE